MEYCQFYSFRNRSLPIIKFDEDLSNKIYAASDFFLMPSKFEPYVLSQMIALKYVTVPIVRSRCGLKDSFIEFNEQIKCRG